MNLFWIWFELIWLFCWFNIKKWPSNCLLEACWRPTWAVACERDAHADIHQYACILYTYRNMHVASCTYVWTYVIRTRTFHTHALSWNICIYACIHTARIHSYIHTSHTCIDRTSAIREVSPACRCFPSLDLSRHCDHCIVPVYTSHIFCRRCFPHPFSFVFPRFLLASVVLMYMVRVSSSRKKWIWMSDIKGF